MTDEEHPATSQLQLNKKLGYQKLKILASTIPNAGWGLFATTSFNPGETICSYEGALLDPSFNETDAGPGRDYIAMAQKPIGPRGKNRKYQPN